jgi:N-(2-amino-2-carboxyethyl)-L-glutamate synthase
MRVTSLSQIRSLPLFYQLNNFLGSSDLFLKLEGLNIAGSIKLRTAAFLLTGLEEKKKITPGRHKIVESSSGNLGIALSILCKEKGYHFTCVIDPNISPLSEQYMKLYDATLLKVTKKDAVGGYLGSRIQLIRKLIAEDASYIWLNQYANLDNTNAHYNETAQEICQEFAHVDYLVIGAGTTGTLMGCASYFKAHSYSTKIIAVDSIGSVTFGHPASQRYIPGIGTSRRPELVDESLIDDLIMVPEKDGALMCHYLLKEYGLFLGGSSGSILAGVKFYKEKIPPGSVVVAISPDFGHKYLDTVYNISWIHQTFGPFT